MKEGGVINEDVVFLMDRHHCCRPLGSSIAALTAQDAFEVMLLRRRVLRRVRFVSFFYRLTWAAWSALAVHLPRNNHRQHLLGVFGPLSMALLFGVWIIGLTTGFGRLLWAAEGAGGNAGPPKFGDQLYPSGATFFTLGYGDVVPRTGFGRVLTVLAGTGFGFIAIVIGYLPVLYQLFSRREGAVIRLDGRAGSPPTVSSLLQRHSGGDDGPEQIRIVLREWEHGAPNSWRAISPTQCWLIIGRNMMIIRGWRRWP